MRNPKDFFQPMAIGAPEPVREIPFRPSRMIHFFDPSNPKMAAKAPSLAGKCDVLLGNLEDAVQADNKVAAREGFVKIAKESDFGECQLWTRVNSLDSPWFLDDVMQIVQETRAEMLDGLSAEQQSQITHALRSVKANLSAAIEADHKR